MFHLKFVLLRRFLGRLGRRAVVKNSIDFLFKVDFPGVLSLCECVGFILSLNKNLMKIRSYKVGGQEWLCCLWREAVNSVWGIFLLRAAKPLLCLEKQPHFSLAPFRELTERSIFYIFCPIQNAEHPKFKLYPNSIRTWKRLFLLESAPALLHAGALLLMCFSPRFGKKQISKRIILPGVSWGRRGLREFRRKFHRKFCARFCCGHPQCCLTLSWSTQNIRGFIISTSNSPRSWHKTSLFFLI